MCRNRLNSLFSTAKSSLGHFLALLLFISVFPLLGDLISFDSEELHAENLTKMKANFHLIGPDYSPPNNFSVTKGFLSKVDLSLLNEIHMKDLETLILGSLSHKIQKKLNKYLYYVLLESAKRGVDPFWVLSIMYTESHFDCLAKSVVGADGLMQIMPRTARYLAKTLKWPSMPQFASKFVQDPKMNIEMGVFYLSFLLKEFQGNHKLATVAYNMGPYWVATRLKKKLPVGKKNLYLDKVRRAYRLFSHKFLEKTFQNVPMTKDQKIFFAKYSSRSASIHF